MAVLDVIADKGDILVVSDWGASYQEWGEKIQLYRDYIAGKHRLEMTQAVADLLQIDKDDGERFAVNYSKLTMQKRADRLKVVSILGASDELTEWADRLCKKQRFDGKQIDVHEATVGDGDNFVMIDSDPLAAGDEFAAMIVEPAYNGTTGIVPIYDLTQQFMVAAVKVWEGVSETVTTFVNGDSVVSVVTEYRVNIYYADRVEKYVIEGEDETLKPHVDDAGEYVFPWVTADKKPLGVPFVHFKNEGKSGKALGESGIKSALPLNDVLNSAMMDMELISKLLGAQIRYVIGAPTPGGAISPGMWVRVGNPDGIPKDHHMPEVGTFDVGDLSPVLELANFAVDKLGAVTETPLPDTAGKTTSGEHLKQVEVGFVARVKSLQTKLGNKWEDVIDLAYRVQMAHGKIKPPEGADGWSTKWASAEVRNDSEIVSNALAIADVVDQRTVLEELAPVYGWDSARIDKIIERRVAEANAVNAAVFPAIGGDAFAGALAEL